MITTLFVNIIAVYIGYLITIKEPKLIYKKIEGPILESEGGYKQIVVIEIMNKGKKEVEDFNFEINLKEGRIAETQFKSSKDINLIEKATDSSFSLHSEYMNQQANVKFSALLIKKALENQPEINLWGKGVTGEFESMNKLDYIKIFGLIILISTITATLTITTKFTEKILNWNLALFKRISFQQKQPIKDRVKIKIIEEPSLQKENQKEKVDNLNQESKQVLLHEINFNDLPKSPDDHDWEPKPKDHDISYHEGEYFADCYSLKINTPTNHALDFAKIDKSIAEKCKIVEFILRIDFIEKRAFYVQLDQGKKVRETWLNIRSTKILKNIAPNRPEDWNFEWLIPVKPTPIRDGWESYKIDIRKAFEDSFGQHPENGEFTRLKGFRLRGPLQIAVIRLYGQHDNLLEKPYKDFTLTKPNRWNKIWDFEVTDIEPKYLKSISFKLNSEDSFWRAGIKFYSGYEHKEPFINQHGREPNFNFHLSRGHFNKGSGIYLTKRNTEGLLDTKKLSIDNVVEISIKLEFLYENKIKYFINNTTSGYVDFDINKYNKVVFAAWEDTNNNFKVDFKDIYYTTT